ncbi:MAG: hypothetical protein MK010_06215, partial [Erythrobacter sp.]|nr:hypothetical protein [Erythrobacter sp.]
MSALSDIVGELVPADTTFASHVYASQDRDPKRAGMVARWKHRLDERYQRMTFAQKMSRLTLANVAAIVLTIAMMIVAASTALEMRDIRMTISDAQVGSAEIAKNVEQARLYGHRFADTGDEADIARARTALRNADTTLAVVHGVAERYDAAQLPAIADLEAQIDGYDR